MRGFFMPVAGAKKIDKFSNRHLTAHGPMNGPPKKIIGGRRPRHADRRLPAKDNLKLLLLVVVATIFGHPAKEPKRR
jgi:hypothetical protein